MKFNFGKKQKLKRSIPLSAADKFFPVRLVEILDFYLHGDDFRILDPTCGDKLSWRYYFDLHRRKNEGFFCSCFSYEVYFSDIKRGEFQDEVILLQDLNFDFLFDAIFFDPPYIFGNKNTEDVRELQYGGYENTYDDFCSLLGKANDKFPSLLKENGLLFLKATDVFDLSQRKYCHHSDWLSLFDNFVIVDCFITLHHHISGTAWQVKERPCSILNYTYLFVMRKKG